MLLTIVREDRNVNHRLLRSTTTNKIIDSLLLDIYKLLGIFDEIKPAQECCCDALVRLSAPKKSLIHFCALREQLAHSLECAFARR